MDRLEDLREEQRTPIGTAVSVLLFAADGPVATELFSDLAAMAIPYEATAMIGDIHYLAAADGNQMSAVGIYTGGLGRSWPIHPDEPMAPWTQTAFGNTNGTAVSWTGSERQRAEFGPDAEVTRWPGDHESRRRNRICATTNMPSARA